MSGPILTTVDLRDGRKATLERVTEDDAPGMLAYLEVIAGETDFLTFGPGEFYMTVDQEAAFLKSLADPLGLSVRQDFWNGLGSALCKTIFSEAKRTGITRIALKVRADNGRAIRLYERLGFSREGRLIGAFLVGGVELDELVMGLRI
jgi:GNAT superfamily N-acetyltransferase